MVAYSQYSVAQQMAMKRRFNDRLADAIARVAVRDRIILDTGDGAALCFMGDPEEALMVALGLLHAFQEEAHSERVPVVVRIGIHIGPVKVMKDINGQLNTIGDGINAAQRVMTFAQPNQILVSRSFYEVVACLSNEYAQMFQYLGAHTDKHIREYIIYEVIVPPRRPGATITALPTATPVTTVSTGVPVPSAQGTTLRVPTWEPHLLEQAEALLGHYLGPVARVLVAQAAQETAKGSELGERLASHMEQERERQQFLDAFTTLLTTVTVPEATSTALYDVVRADLSSTPPPSSTAVTPVVRPLDPQVLQAAQQRLAQYLGPMAHILVQRAAQEAVSVDAFHRLLATHLATSQEQQRFLHDSGL